MLSIRLDDLTQNQLNIYAQSKQTSKSKIIKDALNYYFEMLKQESKSKTPYETGAELFGKYGSEQGDLSTTYKQKLKKKLNEKNSHR